MPRKYDCLFRQASEEWLAHLTPELKVSSAVRYRSILNNHLLPEFGKTPISAISRMKAEKYRQELLCRHPVLSPQTVSTILSILKRVLVWARREHGLPAIDLSDLTVRQSQKPLRVLTLKEQQRLCRYLIAQGNVSAAATMAQETLPSAGILLSLYTGLRIGEVCALKWEDVNLKEKSIHVRKTMQRIQVFSEVMAGPSENDIASGSVSSRIARTQVLITAPKSACSLRTIPLPKFLLDTLKPLAADPSCFFLTGSSDRFMEPRTLENHFIRATVACGISGATFHTLRHTFATRAIELGFDTKSLSEILGHARVNITLNRYVHPSIGFKRKNMDKLAGLLPASRPTDPGSG